MTKKNNGPKKVKVNERELSKMLKIFGKEAVLRVYIADILVLTSQQLDLVCNYGKEEN